MTWASPLRTLLAAVLALALNVQLASAQACTTSFCQPPPQPGPSDNHSNRNAIWYVVGGVAGAALGLFVASRLFPPPERGLPPEPPRSDLPPPQNVNLQPNTNVRPPADKRAPKFTTTARKGFYLPLPGAPIVENEMMLDIPASVSDAELELIADRHQMTRLETKTFRLTGRTLHRWRLDGGGTVYNMVVGMMGEKKIAGAQAIHLFKMSQAQQQPLPQMTGDQYAPEKLGLMEAHRIATGNRVTVAVIDSGIDTSHPDLSGAIVNSYDAAGGDATPHPHGTGMAGALAARRTVLGTAPRVGVLAVRAFNPREHGGDGTTFNILKALDWAVENGARIINMSFAGPDDPRLGEALERASKKGVVLIAAAGNAGPKSPPLYPAANRNVIAVTATDVEDALYTGANRGSHIAVAAPGVEVLVPAPGGNYQFTTGTSVAAAHVSGVVALMMERNPRLTPTDVKRILTRSATPLGRGEGARDFGAGLVNAYRAVSAAQPASAAK
jgi:subtilisin family serine protease